jgi:D-tagatose-1,6-bisphosphate aldolase subunit GatZ/KbaZ
MSAVRTSDPLLRIVAEHKAGAARGIVSICSSHPAVLEAAARHAAAIGAPLLVESTSNQVNQDGGYTGMTPAAFAEFLTRIGRSAGLTGDRILLGADHLGPYPWRSLPAEEAMRRARVLAAGCVEAGYTKLHLDASMACAGDRADRPSKTLVAERTADLCAAAEDAHRRLRAAAGALHYVIGSDVPAPGGETDGTVPPEVTAPEDVQETLEITRRVFARRGLGAAWERVVAVVVQPGVDFGSDAVHEYEPAAAARLSRFIGAHARLVFEAHSTDYQRPRSLRRLVGDHFAILKVGPALTFAFREAVFALALMEREWLGGRPDAGLSGLPAVVDGAMVADPRHWAGYYRGTPEEIACARRYAYADRMRYYWPRPDVQAALGRLFENLTRWPPPLTLLSQFLPEQYAHVRDGRLGRDPREWVSNRIAAVLAQYTRACAMKGESPNP